MIFVLDAMIGQDAVTTAEAFREGVGFTGVVLTKLDGDARGGAALSVREITGVPILFASAGEKLEDFDVFHPDRMASRILGMGDVLSLIEQAEQVFDAQQAEDAAAKIGSGELTLEDFLEQMLAIRKMGPIGNLLGMLPGAGQMKDALAAVDDSQLDRVQAIIRGMTPAERADPKIINGSRRLRIANGSGVAVGEVNQLVDRFFEARKMMSQMAGQMGMPFGRKGSSRKAAKNKKKGKKGGRGPTPPKARNPLAAGMPAGFPDLSDMPKGLDELPPGLADFDLSKLKFPGRTSDDDTATSSRPRPLGLPDEEPVEWWIVDGTLSAEPVSGRGNGFRWRLDRARPRRRPLPRRAGRTRTRRHSTNALRRPRPNAASARCCCATRDRRPTPAASTTTTTCRASSGTVGTSPGRSATRAASRSNWTTSHSCPMPSPSRRDGATAG